MLEWLTPGSFPIRIPELSNSGCRPGKARGSPTFTLAGFGYREIARRLRRAGYRFDRMGTILTYELGPAYDLPDRLGHLTQIIGRS